jgi:glycine hydroxymethyltransferase
MIPSSNIPIPEVNELGVVMGNKSAPGVPGARFFNGDSVIDKMEEFTQMRALEAFNLDKEKWGVNVQPLSGSIANLCLFNAVCDPGDTILSLNPN